jgi:D-sedoheptulose 7-phosphate isomerase
MLDSVLNEHVECFQKLAGLEKEITRIGQRLVDAIQNGNKILVCGNGGSAADAQHFAAEIVGRYLKDRSAGPAIALTTDTSIITAVANDYAYETIFSRQVEAIGRPADILIGLSTSGHSQNIIRAVTTAKARQMMSVALTGGDGGILSDTADMSVVVPCARTPRIQEAHIFILHFWAGLIESTLTRTPEGQETI